MIVAEWSDLDTRARALLDEARVILDGPAASYDGSGRGAPDSRPPTGRGKPTYELLAQALQDAGTGEPLLRAIHWGELQLYRVRYARRVSRREDTPERVRARVLRDWIGSAPEEVSEFESCTVAQVCRWRADLGRDPLSGRAAESPGTTRWQTVDERALRVQQLRAAHPHLSARALGLLVGVSHPTVLSDLQRDSPGPSASR